MNPCEQGQPLRPFGLLRSTAGLLRPSWGRSDDPGWCPGVTGGPDDPRDNRAISDWALEGPSRFGPDMELPANRPMKTPPEGGLCKCEKMSGSHHLVSTPSHEPAEKESDKCEA